MARPTPPASSPLLRAVHRLGAFFAPYGARIALVVLLALGTSGLAALEPLFYKQVFDAVSVGGDGAGRALLFIAVLVVLLLAREMLLALLDCSMWRVRLAVTSDLLRETVGRLHSLPLLHHREETVGALTTKIERGISGSVTAFSDAVLHVLPSIVYLTVSAAIMFRLEWRLSLVVLFFAPIPAIIGARAANEQTTRERKLMKRWMALFGRLNEVLSGIAVVKSFVREEDEKRRFLGGVEDANAIVAQGIMTDASTNATKGAVMAIARVTAIAVGSYLVMEREISLGTLVAFLGYVSGVFQPVQSLTGMYQSLCKGTVSVEAVTSILDAHDSLRDSPDARDVGPLTGAVRFEHVRFEYRPGVPVLRDVSFTVEPGQMIALVGASGGGKSTLMALLQRLYDPTRGRILVDGLDLRDVKQGCLRKQIAVVLQDGWLFDDSIRDNISFGRPEATFAEVEAAARAANAHEFIMRLPAGYDTKIGERGGKLSGGERQRIAIARALLKNAPILVLDEATSALDAESEDAVREALSRLTKGRTTFVIAHRLTTVTEADSIVVFEAGTIVEQGSHEELLRAGGRYAGLVRRQSRGLFLAA
ncbi:MAG: ABC transporter [Myxococcales bacterium 68-20]|nr:ABC transporter ATP-binding protein [Myxococcales bacterium]OJY26057.1 MAG: ABC transporter [Myxococcales bacterium 68-20]